APTSGGLDELEAFSVTINGATVDGIDLTDLVLDPASDTFLLSETIDAATGDVVGFVFTGVDADGDGDNMTTISTVVDDQTTEIQFFADLTSDQVNFV
ncbi:MAG: hypothetical protein AAF568_05230, partial [Pseudomonadota bacterium]